MNRRNTYFLLAGEASGDLHGSNLIREMKKLDPDAEYVCWGGDLMEQAGARLLSHYRSRAFMGLWEVIKNLGTILSFIRQARKDIADSRPTAVILIDNPGFNMRLMPFIKSMGVPVHYYIAPKVWAWNTKRVKKLKAYADAVYAILPFEPDFFAGHGMQVEYVGNPVVDAVTAFQPASGWKEKHGITRPMIALLPGSRRHEVETMLPLLASLQQDFPDYAFMVAGAPGYTVAELQRLAGTTDLKVAENDTYNVLFNAHAAVVASGTATLETAAFGVPQVVCYRVSPLTWTVGKMLVRLQWVSLVNLILNEGLVRELLQDDFNRHNLREELTNILSGPGRATMLQGYEVLKEKLGAAGASARTAGLIVGSTRAAASDQ